MLFKIQSVIATGLLTAATCAAIGPSARADCDTPRPPVVIHRAVPTVGDVRVLGFKADSDGQTILLGDDYFRASGDRGSNGCVQFVRRLGVEWVTETTFIGPLSFGASSAGLSVAVEGDLAAVFSARENATLRVFERQVDGQGVASWAVIQTTTVPSGQYIKINDGRIFVAAAGGTIWQLDRGPSAFAARPIISNFGQSFGFVETLDVDGDTLVVADPGNLVLGLERRGEVRVYRENAGAWTLEAVLPGRPDPVHISDQFGVCVAVDGDIIAVSSAWDPPRAVTGYARIFERTAPGSWTLAAEVTHPTAPDSTGTGFGLGLDVRGNLVAVGASKDDFAGPDAGAVYLYQRGTMGGWSPAASFTLSDSAAYQVGAHVRLAGTGEVIASAHGLDSTGGAVVFDACSVVANPGDREPRCLPGVLGLLAFVEAFFGNDPFADYDRSGTITVQDFFAFLGDWFAGCP